jgi:hypothetical protein
VITEKEKEAELDRLLAVSDDEDDIYGANITVNS